MATQVIDASRIQSLNDAGPNPDGRYVLYWMEQSQRAEHNPALERAVRHANDHGAPLLVACGLPAEAPEADHAPLTRRHHRFALEGLQDTQAALERRGIPLVVRRGWPDDVALALAGDALRLVTDRGYLRHQVAWRARVAEEAGCAVEQVEGDVIVPVEVASGKAEYAARTLRPKLHEHADDYLVDLRTTPLQAEGALALADDVGGGLDLADLDAVLDGFAFDAHVPPVTHRYEGGTRQARMHLDRFLEASLDGYDDQRNQPQTTFVSHLSKYLHFGQISPVYATLRVLEADGPEEDVDSFVEEILVRRELSANFVRYTDAYDSFACLPDWAKETLAEHAGDERDPVYDRATLETAETHDPYWNAAMRQMRYTGYMHNYMRMYWGKKILEWSPSPEAAYETALTLNNTFFLDGRDCNSFGNVAWVFGQHDRGWQERDVYGKVRYMSKGGLERKAKPDAYVEKVDTLVAEAQDAGVTFDSAVTA